MSLAEVEDEIQRNEQRLATLKESRSRAYLQSSAGASEVKEMGNRRKALADKQKSWTSRLKRSESQEIQALQAEIRTRGETTDRAIAEMKAISDETRELTKRQEALDKRRSDLRVRG